MIISGIAATVHADIQGHVLLGHAIDTTRRVPMYCEHDPKRVLGEVTFLHYVGGDLYIRAEVDEDAEKLGDFLSVAGKPLAKERCGSVYHVTKFRLDEISIVRQPANDRCLILDRKPSDTMSRFIKARGRTIDLTIQRVQCVRKYLELMGQQL